MKKIINSIFAKFGFTPPYSKENFKRAAKNYASLITIEQQAIDFVHASLALINNAVRSELKRNGFDPEDALKGKIVVNSTATTSKTDARFKSQVYHVNGFVILRVNWKPNGFTLENNTAEVCKYNKRLLKKGSEGLSEEKDIKKNEKTTVEVEALANKKLNEEKNLKVVK